MPLNLTALRQSMEPGPWQVAIEQAAEAEARPAPVYGADTWEPSGVERDPTTYHVSQYPGETNTHETTRNNGNCGPVATLMALKAFGKVDPTPAEVNAVVADIRKRGGATREERVGFRSATSGPQLARAARSFGLEAEPAWGLRVKDLEAALADGKLVIVLVRPSAYMRSTSTGHWVLVTGVRDGKVIVNDPALHEPSREIDIARFNRAMGLKGGSVVVVGEAPEG